MRRALLIFNPTAGRFPSWLLAERAARILKNHGWEVEIERTIDGDHITSLAKQAVQGNMEALFVVGGDGSLNRALPPLIGSQTALAHLPAGTANVWAQEIGLPTLNWTRWLALEHSAHFLAHGRICDVDVGICNQNPFLLWAGVGLDAFVVHNIEPRSRREKNLAIVQYAAQALWNARKWEGMQLRVQAGSENVEGHFLLAVISNIHQYVGGLATLSPDALLDDGIMDLWLFEGKSISGTIQRAWDLWSGGHVQSEHVRRIPFSQIVLESDTDMFVQLDGEPAVVGKKTVIEVLPRALRVLLPTKTPQLLLIEPE
ncbi:MAG: diacylglycerol kinase family lipid kinase [Anaerolineales bacterium]|nr:diacylglycerol kinase family lipid kinase [Anaerolineales bacterium]